MRLDWNKIVSNAVTVLVASVFMGAAIQLWNGVHSIDKRIDENLTEIRATQSILAPKVDNLEQAIQSLLEHLDDVNNTKGEFDFDEKPTIDLIDEERFNNQMMQQQSRGRR